MRAGHSRSWILAMAGCLALVGCGKGAAGTDQDAAADAAVIQDDAAPHDARQADAGDDGFGPPDGGPGPDATQTDAAGQADAVGGCNVATGQSPYWGNLHAHTGYSDGAGTPSDAYDYARYTAGLDIQVLTDHVEQIPLNGGYAQYQADGDAKYVTGTFLAMAGFEYGSAFSIIPPASVGHANVYFSPTDFGALDVDYHTFYDELYACTGCIGQFNHPGDGTTTTWSDFAYDADAAQRFRLLEFNTPVAWDKYFQALSKGWTVSPQWNQDNHSADWGTANDNRSGFWMSALDRTQLYDAMINNRTFATSDKKAWIRMLANGDCWMGSKLRGISSVPITVEVDDTDNDHGFTVIELFGPDNTTPIGTHDCAGAMTCSASFNVTVPVPPGITFVLARATLTNAAYVVSAPVWASVQ
jgi:hypothetical protein